MLPLYWGEGSGNKIDINWIYLTSNPVIKCHYQFGQLTEKTEGRHCSVEAVMVLETVEDDCRLAPDRPGPAASTAIFP